MINKRYTKIAKIVSGIFVLFVSLVLGISTVLAFSTSNAPALLFLCLFLFTALIGAMLVYFGKHSGNEAKPPDVDGMFEFRPSKKMRRIIIGLIAFSIVFGFLFIAISPALNVVRPRELAAFAALIFLVCGHVLLFVGGVLAPVALWYELLLSSVFINENKLLVHKINGGTEFVLPHDFMEKKKGRDRSDVYLFQSGNRKWRLEPRRFENAGKLIGILEENLIN